MVLGKSETHHVLYASQRSLLVGLWARAHGCPIDVSTQVGPWGDHVTSCLNYFDILKVEKLFELLHIIEESVLEFFR